MSARPARYANLARNLLAHGDRERRWRGIALRSQYPMLVLMASLTVSGLWSLSEGTQVSA